MQTNSNTKAIARLTKAGLLLGLLGLSACATASFQLSAQVEQQGKNLLVNGNSNLPDKALILVSLLDPAKSSDMNHNVIVQEFAQVQAGHFASTLKITAPVPAGKYQLRLRFSSNSYDPSKGVVMQAVGAKGEKLTGPQVVSEGDAKMLISTQEIEYKP